MHNKVLSPMVRALSVFVVLNCAVFGAVLWLLDDDFWRLAFVITGTPIVWGGGRLVWVAVRRYMETPAAEGNCG